MSLQPLPETRDALRSLDRVSGRDLFGALMDQSREVMAIVPSCVGLSVSMLQQGVTFTLVAAPTEVAVLDGIQYAVGGPAIEAVQRQEVVVLGDGPDGLLNEARWAEFARVGAAHGVLSTLSMPVHDDGRVVGGVNIYSGASDAFRGKQHALAAALGAWAPGATSNADLSFESREEARRAPGVLRNAAVIDHAVGVVVALLGIDQNLARRVIAQAAARAGLTEVQMARAFIEAHTGDAAAG
jgi:GAF domain-containing protein